MMDKLRTASNSIVLKIILALIILSFVLTGVSGYIFGGASNYVAKVNGQEIPLEQLEQAIQRDREQLRQELGDSYNELSANEEFSKSRRQFVLNRLIDEILLAQYANKLKLSISKEQVRNVLRTDPMFQIDNQFDNDRYLQVLAINGLSPDRLAENVRNDLVKKQMISAYSDTDFVLPTEIGTQSALDMQQRYFRLATINVSAIAAQQTTSAEEIESYYQQNKSTFALPERVKVSYIEIDAADIQDRVKVTEQDVADFYQQNKALYTQVKRYDFSVIQLKTEQEGQAVLQELQNGADFAVLAKEKSTDLSRNQGGQLDLIEENHLGSDMVKAKLTEKGQISTLIPSEDRNQGFFIFRLNDVQNERILPLAEVRAKITKQLQMDKAKVEYYELQQKIGDATHSDPFSLVGAEQVSKLKVIETDWFTQDDVPEKLQDPTIVRLIFSGSLLGKNGSPASNSDILQMRGDRALVLRIADHQPASFKPLVQVHDQVVNLVQRQKAQRLAGQQADEWLVKLQADKSTATELKFAEQQSLSLKVDGMPLESTLFQMPHPAEGQATYARSIDAEGNVVIIALERVEKGVLPEKIKDLYQQQMMMMKGYASLDSLIQNLRQQAKIDIIS